MVTAAVSRPHAAARRRGSSRRDPADLGSHHFNRDRGLPFPSHRGRRCLLLRRCCAGVRVCACARVARLRARVARARCVIGAVVCSLGEGKCSVCSVRKRAGARLTEAHLPAREQMQMSPFARAPAPHTPLASGRNLFIDAGVVQLRFGPAQGRHEAIAYLVHTDPSKSAAVTRPRLPKRKDGADAPRN